MWGNLGVSLLGFTGAIYVLDPLGTGRLALSFGAGVLALVVGTILGTLAVSVAAAPGAETGAPAMVLLRGLFGGRLSFLPTVLNIVQLVGWTTFELVTISTALQQVVHGVPRWVWVVAGGIVTTALALRPLGWIRVLRRYVTVAVVVAMVYIAIQLLRHPLHTGHGSWNGFWLAVDGVVSVAVSWVPVAADYSRHSKSVRDAVLGSFVGYSLTQIACYLVGMIALVGVANGDANKIFGSFIAVPLGTVAFAVLAVRELDQSFVDTYSTAVSVQNLRPRWDRRVARARDRHAGHRADARTEHRRLLQLPRPAGLGVRAAAGRAGRRLVRRVPAAVGSGRARARARGSCCCRGSPGSRRTS